MSIVLTRDQWQAIVNKHRCRQCIYADDVAHAGELIDSGAPLDQRERVDLCAECMLAVIRDTWDYFSDGDSGAADGMDETPARLSAAKFVRERPVNPMTAEEARNVATSMGTSAVEIINETKPADVYERGIAQSSLRLAATLTRYAELVDSATGERKSRSVQLTNEEKEGTKCGHDGEGAERYFVNDPLKWHGEFVSGWQVCHGSKSSHRLICETPRPGPFVERNDEYAANARMVVDELSRRAAPPLDLEALEALAAEIIKLSVLVTDPQRELHARTVLAILQRAMGRNA